jgi:hypothetical protein
MLALPAPIDTSRLLNELGKLNGASPPRLMDDRAGGGYDPFSVPPSLTLRNPP